MGSGLRAYSLNDKKDSMLWGLDQNSKAEGSHEVMTERGTERIMELKLPLECEREVAGERTVMLYKPG